jgi:hypothetical protein
MEVKMPEDTMLWEIVDRDNLKELKKAKLDLEGRKVGGSYEQKKAEFPRDQSRRTSAFCFYQWSRRSENYG